MIKELPQTIIRNGSFKAGPITIRPGISVNVRRDVVMIKGSLGEDWTRFLLLDRIPDDLPEDDILEGLRISGPHYRGPGLDYARSPIVRHSISRTLISQTGGMDI